MAARYDESILEQRGRGQRKTLLEILLSDQTTKKNILWATLDYAAFGTGYQEYDRIAPEQVSGSQRGFIRSRNAKDTRNQIMRTRQKAEVFTPVWICDAQNNLIDEQWFGRQNVFHTTDSKNPAIRYPTGEKIKFPANRARNWKKYTDARRMEICCGEAPYLVSRYDSVSGEDIPILYRVGILDRKLRIVGENTETEADWLNWALRAFQSVYGFEYQGDSLFLARKNLFFTFLDYYDAQYGHLPEIKWLYRIATVISWNLWQMDGLKLVVPGSCTTRKMITHDLFGEEITEECPCPGCQDGGFLNHNGVYCVIKDWRAKTKRTFLSAMKGGGARAGKRKRI